MYFMRFYLFCSGDFVNRMGEREIGSVSGRLPDNPGELTQMQIGSLSSCHAIIIICLNVIQTGQMLLLISFYPLQNSETYIAFYDRYNLSRSVTIAFNFTSCFCPCKIRLLEVNVQWLENPKCNSNVAPVIVTICDGN